MEKACPIPPVYASRLTMAGESVYGSRQAGFHGHSPDDDGFIGFPGFG
jgi:hypothetical protein